MSSNLTPKNLFGNAQSPDQTNVSIATTPQRECNAVAVTQSQGTQSPMEQLISAMEKHANSPMIGIDAVSTLNECYEDDGMMSQVPASGGFLEDAGDAVQTISPNKRDLQSAHSRQEKKRKSSGGKLAESNDIAMKHQKVRAVPAQKLCIFLRQSRIADAALKLQKKKNGLVCHGSIKAALGNFRDETKMTLKTFNLLGLGTRRVLWNGMIGAYFWRIS
jgi:hypothetical protein